MNILAILRENELEDLKLLIYSLYKNQPQPFNLYLINENVSASILDDFFYFCVLLNLEYTLLNKEFIFLNLEEASSWAAVSSLLPSNVSRILYLNNNVFALHDFSSFYNQDFEDNIFIGCDTENFKFNDKFQVVQENKTLDFDVIVFNNENFNKEGFKDKIKWESSVLYNLPLENSFLIQNPFFEKRLQKKARLVKCNLTHNLKIECKKQLGLFLQGQQEKKFLSDIICYGCKYNCAMSYMPVFNSQHIIKDIEDPSVACFFKAKSLNFVTESGYKALYSEPCPKECPYFIRQNTLTEDIKDFLEKRHEKFEKSIE